MPIRATYVIRNGELVDKADAEPLIERGPAFHYIADGMDPTRHMANGKMYDSKSEFRRATKAAGCQEIGDHKFAPRKPIPLSREQRGRDIKRAIEQLKGQS